MKAELKAIVAIFTIVIVLAISAFFSKNNQSTQKLLFPFVKPLDILSFLGPHKRPSYVVYGYLPYWMLDSAKYLQLNSLTDIAYFGLYINEDGSFKKQILDDSGIYTAEPGYRNWEENKELDKLITDSKKEGVRFALTVIAHEDEANDKFLDCRECWNTLLNNLVIELDSKSIKDVNLNFEYAGYTEESRALEFADFTKFLNEELDKIYGDSYVVVSAFADSATKPRISSKLNELGRYSDGIFMMAYDFHRPTSDTAGPVSPLNLVENKDDFDLNIMLKDFLSQIAPNKLILGVPYYGYNWVVEDDSKNANRIEGSDQFGFSQSQIYDILMTDIKDLGVAVKWDENAQVPYYTYISPETGSIRQVFFEDAESLKKKYDFVKSNSLAGVGIWALGYDGDRPELWNLIFNEFVK